MTAKFIIWENKTIFFQFAIKYVINRCKCCTMKMIKYIIGQKVKEDRWDKK